MFLVCGWLHYFCQTFACVYDVVVFNTKTELVYSDHNQIARVPT